MYSFQLGGALGHSLVILHDWKASDTLGTLSITPTVVFSESEAIRERGEREREGKKKEARAK